MDQPERRTEKRSRGIDQAHLWTPSISRPTNGTKEVNETFGLRELRSSHGIGKGVVIVSDSSVNQKREIGSMNPDTFTTPETPSSNQHKLSS